MKKILSALLVAAVTMFSTVAMAAPSPRDVKMPVLQAIRATVNYSDITQNTLKNFVIGTIPSGSIIVGSVAVVPTAFTSGATPVMAIGGSSSAASASVMAKATLACTSTGLKQGVISPAVAGDTTYYLNTMAADYTQLAAGKIHAIIYYYTGSN